MRRTDSAYQKALYPKLKREVILTKDGSSTINIPELDECYHSRHGAIQEARHVFIEHGLKLFPNALSILEIGFGTGLNAFITFLESKHRAGHISYTAVEAYPVTLEEVAQLNFAHQLNAEDETATFNTLHNVEWQKQIALSENFSIFKNQQRFEELDYEAEFDLIYFDAFGFGVQPELWSYEIFQSMYNALKPGGVLVTYAARSVIKRNMISAGFTVEKLAGPPGKREMMRARK